jgi:hypothetical protein
MGIVVYWLWIKPSIILKSWNNFYVNMWSLDLINLSDKYNYFYLWRLSYITCDISNTTVSNESKYNDINLQWISVFFIQIQLSYSCHLSYGHSSTTRFSLKWPSSGVVTLTKIVVLSLQFSHVSNVLLPS